MDAPGETGDRVPAPVRALVARHLRELDRAAPGLVEMLYLTGSVALGDYPPGASDVDFFAVTSRPLAGGDLAAVAGFHGRLPAAPHYDGVYLDRASLAAMPDDGRAVPHAVNGIFRTGEPCGELNPVLWLAVARHGVAVRGPAAAALGLRVDAQRLHRWNLDNLRGYWRPLAGEIRRAEAGRAGDAVAPATGVVWAALGPARLHYTLATGGVVAKSAAGRYAAGRFPAFADLVGRAVGWRAGRDGSFTVADARTAADLVDAVVDDAWRRWG